MNKDMKNFCWMIKEHMVCGFEALQLLDDLCTEYGTEAVAEWLMKNEPDVNKWLDTVAA